MDEEEGNKQAAISSDEGINQKQWLDDADLGAPRLPDLLSDQQKARLTDPRGTYHKDKAAGRNLRATEPRYHPASWRELGGSMLSTPERRGEASDAYKMAELYPEHRDFYMEIAGANAIGQRNLLTFEDIEDAEAPSFWENIGTLFEPFITPQRALWYGALKLGELLPDPGSTFGDSVQDIVGVIGAPFMAATLAIPQGLTFGWEELFGDGEDKGEGKESSGKPPAEELVLSFSDMIENLYGDVSTGELAKRSEAHMRPWLYGEWSSMPSPTGAMLLDSMMSMEAAEYLSTNGDTRQLRKFGQWMSSDTGRLVMGVSMELIADPLWFLGPAKGTNVIAHGDDIVAVSKIITQTSGKLRTLNPKYAADDFTHGIIQLYKGTPEQITTAELMLSRHAEMANSQVKLLGKEHEVATAALKSSTPEDLRKAVRAIADEKIDAQKIISTEHAAIETRGAASRGKLFALQESEKIKLIANDPIKATAWLNRQVRDLPKSAKVYEGLVDDIGKLVSDAKDIRKLGPKGIKSRVKDKGAWAVHIPFTNKHGYLFKKSITANATQLLRKIGPVDNVLDTYNFSALENVVSAVQASKPGSSALEALGGSHAKLAAYTMLGASNSLLNIPLASWDVFRKAFGTRYMQPMTQSLQMRAASQTGLLPVLGAGTQVIQRIKRVHPKIWADYQAGLTKMMEGYTGLETQLRQRILRLFDTAGRVAEARHKRSASEVKRLTALRGRATDPARIADLNFEIENAKLWANSKEYTLKNVMNEAGTGIETSAGRIEKLSDGAREVSDGIRAIIKEIAGDPKIKAGKLEVEQALVAIARLAKGSNIEKARILSDLKLIQQQLSGLSLTKEVASRKVRRAYMSRMTQLRAANNVIESINPAALTDAIIKLVDTGLPLEGRYSSPEILFKDFVRIFGTEEAARSVLRNTAIAMGSADGAKGMLMFAEKITGDLPPAVLNDPELLRKAIGSGVKDYLSGLRSESVRLHNAWARGSTSTKVGGRDFFPGMKSDDFDILANSLIEKEMLSWKILVPSAERKAFETWADKAQGTEEGITAILAKEAPIVGAGKEHWKEAFGFYSRSKALEQVKVTARQWSGNTKVNAKAQRDILPLASRYSKEEMRRVADAAVADGATVSDRYTTPSKWRRPAKPEPEPKHVPVEIIPDKDIYVPTPDELVREQTLEVERQKLLKALSSSKLYIDPNAGKELAVLLGLTLDVTEAKLKKLLSQIHGGVDHEKALRAQEELTALLEAVSPSTAALIHPPSQSTKLVDIVVDLDAAPELASKQKLSVSETLEKVTREADLQVARSLYANSDSVIIETTKPAAAVAQSATRLAGHNGKYELSGAVQTLKKNWPKLKRGESYYYYPKQRGAPSYVFLDGRANIVAGEAVELGLKDGRDYFIFRKTNYIPRKQGTLKRGEEVIGNTGTVDAAKDADDAANVALMEFADQSLQIGESQAVHERIVHRGADLEEQIVVAITNKSEKMSPSFGEDVHYVSIKPTKIKTSSANVKERILEAKKKFESGPTFKRYKKVVADLKTQEALLKKGVGDALQDAKGTIFSLEYKINQAIGKPKEIAALEALLSAERAKLPALSKAVSTFTNKNITPLRRLKKELGPPPLQGGAETIQAGTVRQVVGHSVEIPLLRERAFFAYKDSKNRWYVVDVATGARLAGGSSPANAVKAAENAVLTKGRTLALEQRTGRMKSSTTIGEGPPLSALKEEEFLIAKGREYYLGKYEEQPVIWGFGERQVRKVDVSDGGWIVKDVLSGITRGKGPTREAAIEAATKKTPSAFDRQITSANADPKYKQVVRPVGETTKESSSWQLNVHLSGKPEGDVFGGTVLLAREPVRAGKPLMPLTKRRIEAARAAGGKFILGDTLSLDKVLVEFLDEIGASYTVYHPSQLKDGARVLLPGRLKASNYRPNRDSLFEARTQAGIDQVSGQTSGRSFWADVLEELRIHGKPKPAALDQFPAPPSPFNPLAKGKSRIVTDLDPTVKYNLEHQTQRVVDGIDNIGGDYQKEFVIWKESNVKDINPRVYNKAPDVSRLLNDVTGLLKGLTGDARRNPFPTADSVEQLEYILREIDTFAGGLGKEFKPSAPLKKKAMDLLKALGDVKKASSGKKFGPLGLFHDQLIQVLRGMTIGGNDGSATIKLALRKIKKTYGDNIALALPREGEAIIRPLASGMTRSEVLTNRLRALDDDTILDTLASLVVKDGISDPQIRTLLKSIYKKSRGTETLAKTTEATLLADITKIKADMSELSRVKYKAGMPTKKAARGEIARKIFGDAQTENRLITDAHNKLSDEFIDKMRELRTALGKNIEPKTIGDRNIKGWEQNLWRRFSKLSEEHGLSNQDQLFAAFAVLREMPRNLPAGAMKNLTEKYPEVIGRRFGDVEKDLVPVMEELESLIKFYELEYAEKIWDIVRSPEQMMERWGVTDFVPHPYHAGTDEISLQLSMAGKSQLGSGTGISDMFFRQMDAAKGRKIAGSISEINAFNSAKEGAVNLISLEPALLWGRYAQVNHALTNDTFIQTLISSGVIRGLRAGDASVAKQFGIDLNRLDGLTKTAEELASELDMVPMFSRNVNTDEMTRFLNSTLDELLTSHATSPGKPGRAEVQSLLEGVAKELASDPAKGFATWIKNSNNMNALKKLEQTTLRLRAAQAADGAELFSPSKRYKELFDKELAKQVEKWNAKTGDHLLNSVPTERYESAKKLALARVEKNVSRSVWDEVSKEMNTLRNKYAPNTPKTQGMHLSAYFDPKGGLWEMYIPRGVYQSMHEVINMDPKTHGLVGRGLEKFNNWWKTRVTVIAIAFSSRNWLANNVSMGFDLGLYGVLNPKTHMQGLKLANAVRYHDEFGSIQKAVDAARKPLSKNATAKEKFAKTQLVTALKATGVEGMLKNGIQLTDEIWMPIDELLTRMSRTGVVSPAYTQVVDINAMEQAMAHMHLHGGALADGTTAAKISKYASNIEDALLVTVPTIMTGGVPVAMTKKFGAEFARGIENQSRIFNFLSNIKKTNNWDDSVAHVNKFLFNYGDLTQVQKRWMRLLLPWFTWNQKNFVLQADLMQKSPALFSAFHRFMSDGVPQVMAATQAESAGEAFVNYDPLSKEKLKEREAHYMHTIQIPLPSLENFALGNISVPTFKRGKKGTLPWQSFDMQWGKLGKDYFPRMKNAKMKGFGLPQEAFVNNVALLMTAADVRNWPWVPLPGELGKQQRARSFASRSRWIRMAGETHALLRLAAEVGSSQHSFFNKPINELTDGRLIAETIDGIRKVPFVGDTMGDIMAQRVGLKGYTVYDKWSGSWKEFLRVDGSANHMLGTLPWSRSLRDAAAMTDQFLMSRNIPWEALAAEGISPDFGEVPVLWSVLDSLTGMRIQQTDPELMKSYADMRTEKQLLKYLESRGLLKSFQNSYVPYKY